MKACHRMSSTTQRGLTLVLGLRGNILDVGAFITAYVLPIVSLALSIAFWLSGRASAERAQTLLDQLDKNARGWQSEIMASAASMLNSSPEIVGQKIYLAKIEGVTTLNAAVKAMTDDLVDNPKSGQDGEVQQKLLKLLLDYQFHYVNTLINGNPLPPGPSASPSPSGGSTSTKA